VIWIKTTLKEDLNKLIPLCQQFNHKQNRVIVKHQTVKICKKKKVLGLNNNCHSKSLCQNIGGKSQFQQSSYQTLSRQCLLKELGLKKDSKMKMIKLQMQIYIDHQKQLSMIHLISIHKERTLANNYLPILKF
jgi:hypothetical protein